MAHLFNRRILLAVCGGIAAYKAAELVRKLQDEGAEVRVLMTRGAREFITPLTLQALSGHPVHLNLLDAEAERGMGHIELARWADLLLVAPATADCMARLAGGRADDLLGAVALASAAPKLLAPAMNQQMWKDASTQANLHTLRSRGIHFTGPDEGDQACGDVGPGRMAEPAAVVHAAAALFDSRLLQGQHVIITAGPTREPLDPVRFISNHSSGRMGFALAVAAIDAGARVTLIAGPVALQTPPRVERVDVITARDMLAATLERIGGCDIFIGCAAVADYRPADYREQKIKKSADDMRLELVRNPDIVASVAARSRRPYTVGFAAETEQLAVHARGKLAAKNLDLVVANDVSVEGSGFNSDDNAALLLWPDGERALDRRSKTALARDIVAQIAELRGPAG